VIKQAASRWRELFRKPHPVIRWNNQLFADFDQSLPLPEYRFVVFDTELTGLDKKKDEIISIGAVTIENQHLDLSRSFHEYIRPDRIEEISEAVFVHRITPAVLQHARPAEEVLCDFIEFCGKSLLVGHFVGLDMAFLNRTVSNK